MKKQLDERQLATLLEMVAAGEYTFVEIGQRFGLADTTVRETALKHGVSRPVRKTRPGHR